MSMAQDTSPEPTAQMEPSATDGQAHELTVILPLKPGGAERAREMLKRLFSSDEARARRDAMGILHDMRIVFFDNDSRMLFATVFDGTWDSYIDDFASKLPDQLDALFAEVEGYPGIRSPGAKDYVRKYQIKAEAFYSAYPDATARQIRKGQRVLQAWEELLDASEE
jgi:hypothetical protein